MTTPSSGSGHRYNPPTDHALLVHILDRVDEIDHNLTAFVQAWRAQNPKPIATSATLTVLGGHMPGSINVDTTNETVTLGFTDDHDDVAEAPVDGSGSPVVVTFTSSDETVVTVATDGTNPLQGDVSVLAEGTSDLGATIAYADGTPVLEADGVTPFPTPEPVPVTVGAGAATGDALVLSV
jgi:hypothetical protein